MTKEEKEILLKDLCARLPYNVNGLINSWKCVAYISIRGTIYPHYIDDLQGELITIKPYLRPLSSMTEEEKETYEMFFNEDGLLNTSVDTYLEWVLENHFDYRGLIPMGLAVEAPEGMYK